MKELVMRNPRLSLVEWKECIEELIERFGEDASIVVDADCSSDVYIHIYVVKE